MAICAGHHFVDLFLCTFFIDAACSWKEIIQHIYMHVLSGELEIKEKVAYNVNYFLHVQVVCNILIILFFHLPVGVNVLYAKHLTNMVVLFFWNVFFVRRNV